MTIPNKVLVVNSFNVKPGTRQGETALAVGQLVALNGETGAIVTAAEAAALPKIQFGVVKRLAVSTGDASTSTPAYIVKTKAFKRSDIEKVSAIEYSAPVEDEYEIDFTGIKAATTINPLAVAHVNLTFSLDARNVKKEEAYVIRLAGLDTDGDVSDEFARIITANRESWATVTSSGGVLTITAKTAVDNMPNAKAVNSPFPYSQTKMAATAYHKDNESVLSSYSTAGIDVDHTAIANPGINNAYLIRDAERAAAGYDSAHFFHVYPNQAPVSGLTLVTGTNDVDATVEYDCVSLALDIKYKAADTNYTKSTTVYNSIYGDNDTFDTDDVMAVLDGTYVNP